MPTLPCRALAVLLLLTSSSLAQDAVRLPTLFGDHMVLQQQTLAPVWGWTEPGAVVSAQGTWSEHIVSAWADADGRWSLQLPTGEAGGPFELRVNETVFTDVLLGEVWLASGQSNMEWPLSATDHAEDDIAAADRSTLRLFTVPHDPAPLPRDDVNGAWAPCSPDEVAAFSAVAYHFGRELQDELDDVPVGLIDSSWGGSVVEAWMSEASVDRFGDFDSALAQLRAQDGEGDLAARQAAWWEHLQAVDPGFLGGWTSGANSDAAWVDAVIPGLYSDIDLAGFDGNVWYRREVDLPAAWAGQELVLELGPVDDMDLSFFNGRQVGATTAHGLWQTPRVYDVPAGLARAGSNVLVVCAVDTGGLGSLGRAGEVQPPMRLRLADDDAGTGVALEGTWRARTGATMGELGGFPSGGGANGRPVEIHNGMIAPLQPFALAGALWYQGEANVSRATQYRRLFPAMINDWRRAWGTQLPFYFVQLAPYGYGGDVGQAAELREAQAMALSLPNTGMAVTMDVGNPADIHPRDKRTVAHRLALWALSETYGVEGLAFRSPSFDRMTVRGREARLSFRDARGLTAGGNGPTHFTVAGRDRVFHPARARLDGELVVVTSDAVISPHAVRYAWGAGDEPNLRNGAGLPMPSFRTDDWAPVSAAR
jgi:sialate O-acetylesterase